MFWVVVLLKSVAVVRKGLKGVLDEGKLGILQDLFYIKESVQAPED